VARGSLLGANALEREKTDAERTLHASGPRCAAEIHHGQLSGEGGAGIVRRRRRWGWLRAAWSGDDGHGIFDDDAFRRYSSTARERGLAPVGKSLRRRPGAAFERLGGNGAREHDPGAALVGWRRLEYQIWRRWL
jgi:hypothetical protein